LEKLVKNSTLFSRKYQFATLEFYDTEELVHRSRKPWFQSSTPKRIQISNNGDLVKSLDIGGQSFKRAK
jgi:hypothetical protein